MPLKFILYKSAPIDRRYRIIRLIYLLYIYKQDGSKNGSWRISVVMEPK
jgi:hypothetical protein